MKPKAICVDVSHLLKEIWIRADDTDVLTLNIESPVFILAIIQALFEDVFCLVVKNKIPLNEKHFPRPKDTSYSNQRICRGLKGWNCRYT
jgi:hypothetical protein